MDTTQQAFQAFERDGWEAVAAAYAELTADVTSQVAPALLDAAGVDEGAAVVDVACGPGWTAGEAHARGASVTGIDISTAMVAEASARFPGVAFQLGAAEELPLESDSADVVVSAFGMPHFADHGAFASEARRVLRPGGRIAFASWNPPAENPFFGVALGSIAKHGDLSVDLPEGVDMFAWADDEQCQSLLGGAGFVDMARAQAPLTVTTDNGPELMVHFLQNAAVRSRALFQAQTTEAKQAIIGAIADMLAPMESDGTWTIPLNAFVVTASAPQ